MLYWPAVKSFLRLCLDIYTSALALWLLNWRSRGDANGWWALANAWGFWLLLSGIPAGFLALARRSRLLGLAWAGLLLGWLGERYAWSLPRPLPQATAEAHSPDGEQRLKIFSNNLLNEPRDLHPLLQRIDQHQPDVLLFQECIPPHAVQLDARLPAVYSHRLWLPDGHHWMGLAVASRRPFAFTGCWHHPGFEAFALRVTLPVPPAELDIYCVQFTAPSNEVRRHGPTRLLRLREAQTRWVLAQIGQRRNPALVMGDWNTTEATDAYRMAAQALVDGWQQAGRGPGFSWPRQPLETSNLPLPPLLRLDYLFHTGERFAPGLRVEEMHILRQPVGSDHCPLLARVAFSPPPAHPPRGNFPRANA